MANNRRRRKKTPKLPSDPQLQARLDAAARYANSVINMDYKMAKQRQDNIYRKHGMDPQPPMLVSSTPRPYGRKVESFENLAKLEAWERRAWNAGNTNQWSISDEELKDRLVKAIRGPRGLQGWQGIGDFVEREMTPEDAYEAFYVGNLNFEFIYGPEEETARARGLIDTFINNFPDYASKFTDPSGEYYRDYVRAELAGIDIEED